MEGTEVALPLGESARVPVLGWAGSVRALSLGQTLSPQQMGSQELREKGHTESKALFWSCSE